MLLFHFFCLSLKLVDNVVDFSAPNLRLINNHGGRFVRQVFVFNDNIFIFRANEVLHYFKILH